MTIRPFRFLLVESEFDFQKTKNLVWRIWGGNKKPAHTKNNLLKLTNSSIPPGIKSEP